VQALARAVDKTGVRSNAAGLAFSTVVGRPSGRARGDHSGGAYGVCL